MTLSLLALVLGFGMNILVKRPVWVELPIHLVGKFVSILESILNDGNPDSKKGRNPRNEYLWGIVMAVLVTITCSGIVKLVLILANMLHPFAAFLLESLVCWQLLDIRSVQEAAEDVYEKLRKADVELTTESDITKKTVKLIMQDMISSAVAPMFYIMLGGAALGFFYAVIRRMAKIVGVQNDRYCHFGIFAVTLEKMFYCIPAYLSTWFVLAAVSVLQLDRKNAWRIYRKDRKKQKSQNGAYIESVVSGALHIQLADTVWDFEEVYEKQLFEEDGRPVKPTDILRINRLMHHSITIALIIFVIVKGLIIFSI